MLTLSKTTRPQHQRRLATLDQPHRSHIYQHLRTEAPEKLAAISEIERLLGARGYAVLLPPIAKFRL